MAVTLFGMLASKYGPVSSPSFTDSAVSSSIPTLSTVLPRNSFGKICSPLQNRMELSGLEIIYLFQN